MARVKTYVHAVDPKTHEAVVLRPGDEVPTNLSKVVTNPAALMDDDAPDDAPGGDGYESQSVTDLRAELERRELDSNGKKPDLVERLREHDAGQQ